jgi:hypothetical protein
MKTTLRQHCAAWFFKKPNSDLQSENLAGQSDNEIVGIDNGLGEGGYGCGIGGFGFR